MTSGWYFVVLRVVGPLFITLNIAIIRLNTPLTHFIQNYVLIS
jgi:hypothetical protein